MSSELFFLWWCACTLYMFIHLETTGCNMEGCFVFYNLATFFHYAIKIVSVAKMTLISFFKSSVIKKKTKQAKGFPLLISHFSR